MPTARSSAALGWRYNRARGNCGRRCNGRGDRRRIVRADEIGRRARDGGVEVAVPAMAAVALIEIVTGLETARSPQAAGHQCGTADRTGAGR